MMNTAETNPENDRAEEDAASAESQANSHKVASAVNENEKPAAVASGPDELSREQAVAERNRYFDQWKRAQAELDNYRKRVQKESEQNLLYASVALMRDLLPGLDNLDRAIKAAESSGNTNDLVEGVRMVSRQFEDVFARHSATPIDALGKPFDPNLHEAVQQFASAEHPPMTVLEVLEKGFVLRDRVVRPAKVIVSAAPTAQTEASEDESEPPFAQ